VTFSWRSWWNEERPTAEASSSSPTSNTATIAAAVAVVVASAVEVWWRTDLLWPPVAFAMGAAMGVGLLLRRRWPLLALAGGLALGQLVSLAAVLAGQRWVDLGVQIVFLAYVYSLFRWGSGRESGVGLVLIALAWTQGLLAGDMKGGVDVVGSAIVLLFPAVLGRAVRTQASAQARALDDVRFRERTRLARELHDTVAHHVSAILMQARAGQAVGQKNPAAAMATLDAIEGAAASALHELRDVVGALRDDDAPRAPVRGRGDLVSLGTAHRRELGTPHDGPDVVVDVAAGLERDGAIAVRPAVDAAVYRVAQEAVTNARRHARGANQITIRLFVDDDDLVLQIDDDGVQERGPRSSASPGDGYGYGLVGMAERTQLLGGRFWAGPMTTDPSSKTAGAATGWRVEGRFPLKKDASEVQP